MRQLPARCPYTLAQVLGGLVAGLIPVTVLATLAYAYLRTPWSSLS